tara:strand:+ start:125 stop:304 length:180 start_codon:yes stop_codon:yes gene_type:complete
MKHFKFENMDLVCSPYLLTFEKDKELEVTKPLKHVLLKFSKKAEELPEEPPAMRGYVCK